MGANIQLGLLCFTDTVCTKGEPIEIKRGSRIKNLPTENNFSFMLTVLLNIRNSNTISFKLLVLKRNESLIPYDTYNYACLQFIWFVKRFGRTRFDLD